MKTKESMGAYAEQQAIAFADWITKNVTRIEVGVGRFFVKGKTYTTSELYEKFKSANL